MPGNSEGHRRDRGEGSDERRSDYSEKVREKKMAEGSKKNGCAPKLFMLLLPFVALGTCLLLKA